MQDFGIGRTGPEAPMKRHILIIALACAALPPTAAQAQGAGIELAGTRYAPSAQVGSATLQLNGAGIRYKFVIKVYTAALYLGSKTGSVEQVLSQPGPKRMHVVMLRDIDANELGKLFTRGMQDNAPKEEFSKFIPGTLKLAEIFSAQKKLKAGDSFFVDFVPGVGTTVLVNGKPTAEPIKEPEFYSALLRIWLGDRPADSSLKDALLGKGSSSNPGGAPG
jgi:hypothetical protein